MPTKKILKGKKVLIVDDELDVLDSLIELLDMCKIDTALSFEDGKRLLEDNYYDIAILDIMGVKGFDLLKIANSQNIPALMLTANALTEEYLKKSVKNGAAYFAPKDKMQEIDFFVADVLQALEMKKNTWEKWLDRLGGFYDSQFQGTNWRNHEKQFWEEKVKTKF